MDLFDSLIDEHRVISRVLDAFEHFIAEAEKGGALELGELNRFVVFFREFADLIHHDREERLLFPAMEKLGYSRAGAPIAHVIDEHERERKILFALRQAAVRTRPVSSARKAQIVGSAHELVAFERDHIRKENELLYPAVKKEFSGQTLEDVTRKLWSGEGAERVLVEDSWLRALADDLVREHGAS